MAKPRNATPAPRRCAPANSLQSEVANLRSDSRKVDGGDQLEHFGRAGPIAARGWTRSPELRGAQDGADLAHCSACPQRDIPCGGVPADPARQSVRRALLNCSMPEGHQCRRAGPSGESADGAANLTRWRRPVAHLHDTRRWATSCADYLFTELTGSNVTNATSLMFIVTRIDSRSSVPTRITRSISAASAVTARIRASWLASNCAGIFMSI